MDLGFGVWGLGSGVWVLGLGFGVWGLEHDKCHIKCMTFITIFFNFEFYTIKKIVEVEKMEIGKIVKITTAEPEYIPVQLPIPAPVPEPEPMIEPEPVIVEPAPVNPTPDTGGVG